MKMTACFAFIFSRTLSLTSEKGHPVRIWLPRNLLSL
jgi:hypothetical protein